MSQRSMNVLTILSLMMISALMIATVPVRAGVIKATAKETCKDTIPCGWAIYSPFVRKIEYFVKNVCVCAPDVKCTRTHDDLSVSAYVYHCLPDKRSTTESSSGA